MPTRRKTAIVVVLVALYAAAWLLPRLLVPSGLRGLPAEQQRVADTAREQGMTMLWEKPLEKLLITRVKVEILAVGGPQAEPGRFPEGWAVRLTARSLFGLPYGQMVYTAQAIYTNETPNVWGVDLPVRMAGGPIALAALLILTIAAGVIWPRTQVK